MRISELVERTGVPLATVKFYLRQGMLPPGEAVSATRAEYGEAHVRRIGLIRALSDVAGLPLGRVKDVLDLIDEPGGEAADQGQDGGGGLPDTGLPDTGLFDALGQAVAALPPYLEDAQPPFPRAEAAIAAIGQVYDERYAAVAQLERALEAVEAGGIPMTEERLHVYAAHLRAMAEYDLSRMPEDGGREAQLGYAVLGTALYDPVVAALRRLAHQDVAARRLGAPPPPAGAETPKGT
ncbi:MerR family transcriptional regulator [Leifsonia shinshuensis]|uniref:DNA-binding transcriptional MerR regulator n=1 Tax=Leifsonia shinshuensis TaxID=150026 RepID=A0A853CZ73_9MICO|nr:MerR family transcriptional regulator [Leifsonia shinshuensis]NYJ25193.1 DNA-binding transcriptional MerR regulator [Leifsonia shinshuensis]